MLYRHELLLQCVHQIFEREYTRGNNTEWTWIHKRQQYRVETALLVDRSDSDRCLAAIAWASCCLFSVEQCLAAFAWASCCHTCTSTDEHAVSESAYARINPYSYLTASAYARVICMCEWIADRIKNGGAYWCLSLTRVFLASKTSLSIADHLRATFINRSTCEAYIETLKMPLTHKQAKKWWTNKQTNQTLYPCRACGRTG